MGQNNRDGASPAKNISEDFPFILIPTYNDVPDTQYPSTREIPVGYRVYTRYVPDKIPDSGITRYVITRTNFGRVPSLPQSARRAFFRPDSPAFVPIKGPYASRETSRDLVSRAPVASRVSPNLARHVETELYLSRVLGYWDRVHHYT